MSVRFAAERLLTALCAGVLGVALWPAVHARATELPAAERQKIEALIAAVERQTDVRFIRNGKAYGAAAAARFLRGKWRAREAEVRSAQDFIEKVASVSSTTGKPYHIRFADGREMPSAAFLRELLA